MANSPLIYGPNNTALNLQNGTLLANGALINSNGPKNYITLGNFENNATTGWSLGITGTLTSGLPTGNPTFGSGAAGTASIAATSSNVLSGNYSLSFVNSAATVAGNMIATQAYTIDASDQGKLLQYKFSYNIPSGAGNGNFSGSSSNTFAVACYDVTNSAWLSISSPFLITNSSGSAYAFGTLTTASTTASIRFVIYSANASSGAITMNIDDVLVGPQITVLTNWMSFTPTFSNLGTVSNVQFAWRQIGDAIDIRGYFTVGTSTTGFPIMSLPGGKNLNVPLLDNATALRANLGDYARLETTTGINATSRMSGYVTMNTPLTGAGFVVFQADSASNTFATANANSLFSAGDIVTIKCFGIPVIN